MKCFTVQETIEQLKRIYRVGVPKEIREHFDNCSKCKETQKQAQELLLKEANEKDGHISSPYVNYGVCEQCGHKDFVYFLSLVPKDCPFIYLCAKCFREYREQHPVPVIKTKHCEIGLKPPKPEHN